MMNRLGLAAALMCALAGCKPATAPAALRIESGWARATPLGAKTGAGYLSIINGAEPDRLLGVASSAAQAVSLHETALNEGVMTMRPLAGGLALPAGDVTVLKPGGRHLMFTGLKAPFVEGDRVEVILRFEKRGEIKATLPVLATAPDSPHNH